MRIGLVWTTTVCIISFRRLSALQVVSSATRPCQKSSAGCYHQRYGDCESELFGRRLFALFGAGKIFRCFHGVDTWSSGVKIRALTRNCSVMRLIALCQVGLWSSLALSWRGLRDHWLSLDGTRVYTLADARFLGHLCSRCSTARKRDGCQVESSTIYGQGPH